jgi:catechol 2,3-dioxygenase-like lactoylglutathione lyase family enzyme
MAEGKELQPAVDMKKNKLVRIGIVVSDAAKTSKRYSEIFGVEPWLFYDTTSTNAVFAGNSSKNVDAGIRIAVGNLTGLEIELIQPLYGPGAQMEFLQKHGEGIHHISFGEVDNYDEVISRLQDKGIGIEMQGTLGNAVNFSYMDTIKELGTVFEILKPSPPSASKGLIPWGIYSPPTPPLWKMEGKRINQIGLVVDDAEGMSKRYEELFGIGPWRIMPSVISRAPFDPSKPITPSKAVLHGIPMISMDLHLKIAIAYCGDMQIELIEPLKGPGTHWDFLKVHGNGVHHFSFGRVNDHDQCIAALQLQGIAIDMTGPSGGGSKFTYMATQKDLGTICELVHVPPGKNMGMQ